MKDLTTRPDSRGLRLSSKLDVVQSCEQDLTTRPDSRGLRLV